MAKIVHLSHAAQLSEENVVDKDGVYERDVLMVYDGAFDSMDGPVEVTPDMIENLSKNHNGRLAKLKRLATGEVKISSCPPVQLDHSRSAAMTVGRLVGDVRTGEVDIGEGEMKHGLIGRIRFLGADNIEKAKDGRYSNVSIGADLENGVINELSVTPFPAAPKAALLSQGDKSMKKLTERFKKYFKLSEDKDADEKKAKFKKHLTECKKMSEEDADKKLAEANDEEMSALSAEVDAEDEKKRLVEADEESKKADKEAKMAAKKGKVIQLSRDMRSGTKGIALEAKKARIAARLSTLRSEGKLTPAEQKKIDISKLATSDDASIALLLETMSGRQPVLDTSVQGTSKAVNLGSIAKKYRMARMELESRLNMPSKAADAKARMSALADEEAKEIKAAEGETTVHIDTTPHEHYEMSYNELSKMLDDGVDKERIKAHVKKMMDDHKAMAGGSAEESVVDEKRMSTLDESVKKLQTQFNELIELVATDLGIESKDLE